MTQRVFIVYRASPADTPKAIDVKMPEADDIIGRFDWYGARADTAEAAINEFEEFEKSEQRDEMVYRRRIH